MTDASVPMPAGGVGSRPGPSWPARALARWPVVVLPLLGLLVWQLVDVWANPRDWLLPGPATIARTAWHDRSRLWFHARATIAGTVVGLAAAVVAGLLLAAAISASRAFARVAYPWVIASQTVPILAVAPLFVIWVDYGVAQILVAGLVSVFPVVVAGVDGLRSVDGDLVSAHRTLGATRAWVWRHVTLPSAIPQILSGVRMSAVFAVTGAVVAEYVGSERGLGYLSQIAGSQFETALVFACIACLALIGVALFALVSLAERALVPYRHQPARRRRRSP